MPPSFTRLRHHSFISMQSPPHSRALHRTTAPAFRFKKAQRPPPPRLTMENGRAARSKTPQSQPPVGARTCRPQAILKKDNPLASSNPLEALQDPQRPSLMENGRVARSKTPQSRPPVGARTCRPQALLKKTIRWPPRIRWKAPPQDPQRPSLMENGRAARSKTPQTKTTPILTRGRIVRHPLQTLRQMRFRGQMKNERHLCKKHDHLGSQSLHYASLNRRLSQYLHDSFR